MSNVYLRDGDMNNADLSNTNLSNANLRKANLRDGDLSNTNLSNADLSNADLSNADLSNADLSNAIFLATDLRLTKNLTQQQLLDQTQPFICHSPLPKGFDIEGGMNRDCGRVAEALLKRYPNAFNTRTDAEAYVAERRQKVWD
ncbi:MAG: pentapeptide repeat-containing protein [Cyanobacteria bacterium J06555_13]